MASGTPQGPAANQFAGLLSDQPVFAAEHLIRVRMGVERSTRDLQRELEERDLVVTAAVRAGLPMVDVCRHSGLSVETVNSIASGFPADHPRAEG
jgi:hypothetical protein